MKYLLLLIFMTPAAASIGQPGTDIYLFDIKKSGDNISLENPNNITNRTGYDNQPFFHPDKSVVYFVSADAEGRTDIFEYDYKKNKTWQLTSTAEREYSPTVTPDKKFLSCIIQRDNGAQDLGKYPIDGGEAEVLIDNLIVGYHAWAGPDRVAVFTLPQPFKLQLIDFSNNTNVIISEKIGRSLHKVPGENAISFVHSADSIGVIKKVNMENLTVSEITKAISSTENDMAWTPDGGILMTSQDKVYIFDPSKNTGWSEVGLQGIEGKVFSRLAVSGDGKKLALVVSE